jgi:3',5'-cyclic-AMP phosphodiesterase
MDRREFIKQLGLGLAAGWVAGRVAWPFAARAADPEVRLALLADAHLKDGNDRRPEALALARAVAEIGELSPPPELVLFAGDLAHRGRPDALDLGREILAGLPAPVWAVCGEGDHGPRGNSAWVRRWGAPWFSRALPGCQLIGLDTSLSPAVGGPVFEIGPVQLRWLAHELARLAPDTPLVILSHAPLARLFHPWQQWTGDAPEVARMLGQFSQVICLHGHVHGVGIGNAGARGQGSGVSRKIPPIPPLEKGGMAASPPLEKGDLGGFSGSWVQRNNFEPFETVAENHLSLPATAWPRPLAVQGTPATPRPGLGPGGCGWALATLSPTSRRFQPYLWQA